MNRQQRLTIGLVALGLIIGLAGCSGMSRQDRNTVAGAGIGGVAGSILTDGSTVGTLGGAAVGGIIGHGMSTGGRGNRNSYWDQHRD
jgi:osmotically inducible lipoprotein OsmB